MHSRVILLGFALRNFVGASGAKRREQKILDLCFLHYSVCFILLDRLALALRWLAAARQLAFYFFVFASFQTAGEAGLVRQIYFLLF